MKYFSAIFFLLAFSLPTFSQTPVPTPPDDTDTVKITTNLIQIDVTVTDKKGKPVTDVRPEEFEVFENGVKQKISDVSFVSIRNKAEEAAAENEAKPEIEYPAITRELKPNEVRRTIALVVDDLSLSFESVGFIKRALRNFVEKQMQDGDLVAIIRSSAGVGALQQFTTNKQHLLMAVESIRWKKSGGTGKIGIFSPFSVGSGDLDPKTPDADTPTSEADIDGFRKNVIAAGSLGAIQYVIESMSRMPGRRSIMLLSDGFETITRGSNGFAESTYILNVLKDMAVEAKEASIVIYSMDTRGLQTLDFTAADDLGSRPIRTLPTTPDAGFGTQAVTQSKTEGLAQQRRDEFRSLQDGMNYLAKETGGIFIRNTNDLYGGIKQMLDEESYYLIAYETESEELESKSNLLNTLDVKVNREGVEVSYKSVFWGADEQNNRPSPDLPANEQLTNALISPFPTGEISLKLSSLFQGSEKNKLFINSLLYIDVSHLEFKANGTGTRRAAFDLLAANFDDNGIPTDQMNKTFTIDVKNEIYERMLKEGFIYYFTLPVKQAGAYQMRVAIRDQTSGKIGSVNQLIGIPKLKNKEMALSGIALDNIPYQKWNAGVRSTGGKMFITANDGQEDLSSLTDTARRKFKRGSVLRYGLEIYNATTKKKDKSNLYFRTRVFLDNKVVYEGKDFFIDVRRVAKKGVRPIEGAINIGTDILSGNYTLQIIVTEQLGKKNRQIATQFVQFEVIE
jgi:VWFA-related protein